jgi:glyoxylase-like metal-dependent hydrolase (beta-lactamase superfamily II)/L-amino acid N-acyltransferase YncA
MQITGQVHALKVPFQVPASPDRKIDRFVYVYLIYGERVWLIDTGIASSDALIFDYLRKTGRSPEDIAGIILTHSHPDHIGAAGKIQAATGCLAAAHAAERNWIEDVGLQERERPVPGFKTLVGGPVKVSRIVAEGDVLQLDQELTIEVLHTPGHSRGSLSLLLRDQGVLFSGDAVPVPGDMPIYEDSAASAASVSRLRAISGLTHLLSSWDDPREGSAVYGSLDRASACLARTHAAVMKAAGDGPAGDAMDLCRQVLAALELPPAMANPLVARSFQAHLAAGTATAHPENYRIRRAVNEDCDCIVRIFNHYVEHSFAAYPEQPLDRRLFDFLKTIIYGDAFFVVEDAGRDVVGFGFLKKYHPYPAFDRTAEAGYFLLPEHTRRGAGGMLLNRLEEEARELGIDNLLANISARNPQSLAFHEKRGFRQCGRFEKILTKFGQDVDIVWMQKRLQ